MEASHLNDDADLIRQLHRGNHTGFDTPFRIFLDFSEGTEGWNASFTSYSVRKFVGESISRPSASNVGNTPWIYIRYGEILLNYAEAMYHLGDENTARNYVNMIRQRESVQMPPVLDSGVGLLKRIQHERRIELVFEEHRFFDVR